MALLIYEKFIVIHRETFGINNMEGISPETAGTPSYIHILNIYCPQGRIEEDNIQELQGRFKTTTIIIGDFNCHHPAWRSSTSNAAGLELIEIIEDNQLTILNNGAVTRVNPDPRKIDTAIDITLATEGLAGSLWEIIDDTHCETFQ